MNDAILDTAGPSPATPSSSSPVRPSTAPPPSGPDEPGPDGASSLARALEAMRGAVTVATLFRTLGAAAIVGSLSLYLLQGFDARGDLARVFTLLGQSGLLALAGLAVGFALREPKGARVFLTLCLVSVPANFAVLGAMIYSIAPLDGGQLAASYPAFATWRAETTTHAWQALGAGLALLLPITAFAFAVLARHRAVVLSLALLAGSALLLVPVRLPGVTLVVAGVMLIGVVTFFARARRRSAGGAIPMTFEEKLAHALLLLPPTIMLGRTVLVHGAGVDSAMPLAMAAWFLCHGLVEHTRGTVRRQRLLAALGSVAGIATAALAVPLLSDLLDPASSLVGFAAVSGVLSWSLARRTDEPGARRTIGALWCAAVLAPVGAFSLLGASGFETLAAVVVASGVIVHGVLEGRHRRTVIGALALLGVVAMQADVLVAFALGGGWRGLAAVGVATIVVGSLLERFGPALKLRFERHREARAGDSIPLATTAPDGARS